MALATGGRYVGWSEGAFEFVAKPESYARWWFSDNHFLACTWGNYIFYKSEFFQGLKHLRRHEQRHVLQHMILGSIAPIAYGIASLWAVLCGGNWYSDNWFEKDAEKAENLP